MEYNLVGKIAQTHGVKGEVKVKTDTSFIDERFKECSTLYTKDGKNYNPIKILSHRSMNGYELIFFDGYDNMDKSMTLIGKTLYGERDRSLLEENTYFYADYIGLNVSQFNKIVGKVVDIAYQPHSDYLIIRNEKNEERLVPLRNEFVEKVDLENKVVYIVDMEGLLYD